MAVRGPAPGQPRRLGPLGWYVEQRQDMGERRAEVRPWEATLEGHDTGKPCRESAIDRCVRAQGRSIPPAKPTISAVRSVRQTDCPGFLPESSEPQGSNPGRGSSILKTIALRDGAESGCGTDRLVATGIPPRHVKEHRNSVGRPCCLPAGISALKVCRRRRRGPREIRQGPFHCL